MGPPESQRYEAQQQKIYLNKVFANPGLYDYTGVLISFPFLKVHLIVKNETQRGCVLRIKTNTAPAPSSPPPHTLYKEDHCRVLKTQSTIYSPVRQELGLFKLLGGQTPSNCTTPTASWPSHTEGRENRLENSQPKAHQIHTPACVHTLPKIHMTHVNLDIF